MAQSPSTFQSPKNALIPGRPYWDGVSSSIRELGSVAFDSQQFNVKRTNSGTVVSLQKETVANPLPFACKVYDGTVWVYIGVGQENHIVHRNGRPVNTILSIEADGWTAVGVPPVANNTLMVKVVSNPSTYTGTWPDGNSDTYWSWDYTDDTSLIDDPAYTFIPICRFDENLVLHQLHTGIIDTNYVLTDTEIWSFRGDTSTPEYLSLEHVSLPRDTTIQIRGFRSPEGLPDPDDNLDMFVLRSERSDGPQSVRVKYMTLGQLKDMMEDMIPDPCDCPPDEWWTYGPDDEIFPCDENNVYVWDPCSNEGEGGWTSQKFWKSGDVDGATTYGSYISRVGGFGGKGDVVIDVSASSLMVGTVPTVAWESCFLSDLSDVDSVDWGNRILYDTAGIGTVNWNSNLMFDGGEVQSINWLNRILHDTTGVASVDWSNRILKNTDGDSAIDWQNGVIYGGASWAPVIDWSNIPSNGVQVYTSMLISGGIQIGGNLSGSSGLKIIANTDEYVQTTITYVDSVDFANSAATTKTIKVFAKV